MALRTRFFSIVLLGLLLLGACGTVEDNNALAQVVATLPGVESVSIETVSHRTQICARIQDNDETETLCRIPAYWVQVIGDHKIRSQRLANTL